jgi:ATP-binding cassette subfamily C exporter for protease/lipase
MNFTPMRLLLGWLRLPYLPAQLLGLNAAIALLTLVPTLYMLQVFDRVMVNQNLLTLVFISLLMFYLWGVLTLGEWLRGQWLAQLGTLVDEHLSPKVFAASFMQLHEKNSIHGRPLNDVVALRTFITGPLCQALIDAPFTFIFVAVLFLMHPLLGWASVCLLLVQVAFAVVGHHFVERHAKSATELQNVAAHFLRAKLSSLDTTYAMGMLARLKARWLEHHAHAQKAAETSNEVATLLADISKLLRYVQQAVSLAVGALLAMQGEITAASMIAANVLMSKALAPVDQLAGGWRQIQTARDALDRLVALLNNAGAQTKAQGFGVSVSADQGVELTCDRLTVKLPSRRQPVLSDVNLLFPSASLTVIMGPSGSGKSSLAKVFAGVFAAHLVKGTCRVNGQSVKHGVPLLEASAFGYLPQTVELFDATVAENIARLGAVDATAVLAAAKATGLHDLILALPNGYDTRIGENGRRLAGGFRQRLGLARALYGSPRLLVLDEPDANLDVVGEQALVETLMTLKAQGMTLILISHRAHWLERADRLVVLAAGEVQASGPCQSVLAAFNLNK